MPDNPTPHSEFMTRKQLIDPRLKDAGWKVVAFDPNRPLADFDRCAIEEYPTELGPADYAMCMNGMILGVVEAKKLTLGVMNVLTQAERYSRGATSNPFNFNGYHVPFLYSTNGEAVWYHDIRHILSRSRQVAKFHTPDALVERFQQNFDEAIQKLSTLPNEHERLRPYQRRANEAIENAIAERKRSMLVAMATGTGKTFVMVNEAYRLMKSNVAKRILFLVDRRALAAQAVRSFASFDAEPGLKFDQVYEVYSQKFQRDDFGEEDKFDPKVLPATYLTRPDHKKTFVYVCTIQRMIVNLFGRGAVFDSEDTIDDDAEQLSIPTHAFDVVIADECHRGYSADQLMTWRRTFDHFDAIKIGLTATPAAHTMDAFKEKVFDYPYEEAVRDGYLVDYDVVKVSSNVRMKGLFLQEGEQVKNVDPESGAKQLDLLEDERKYDTTDIEEKVTSPDSNKKILEEIRKYATEHEAKYGRFPKTLIFAVNDIPHISHADRLVEMARDIFGRGDTFVQKITGKSDRPLQAIRNFRNRLQTGVVVTVDLLSTGVDIPDLEYIVFLRPVKSRILFEQMIGRGTRKGEHFPDKSHFVVFDCFDGTLLEYFRKSTGITAEPPAPPTRTIAEVIEAIWKNDDRDYNIRILVKRLHRIDKEMSGEARDMFAVYIPDGDMKRYATDLPVKLRTDFTGTMSLLRNADFQNLLVNYPRRKWKFVEATENIDVVNSEWLVRGADGKEYKPEDYLQAFEQFVREHQDEIDAIRVLLKRPKGWNTNALSELKTKLEHTPQHFTVTNLQKVHERHYRKALADIISMVKHAADEANPLRTSAERVESAYRRITAGRTFTPDQQLWLDGIRKHLVENLSIEQDDFDALPIFQRLGTWNKANRDFHGELPDLIQRFNEAIAA